MTNPVQTRIPQADGSYRQVIIEPVLEKNNDNVFLPTGIFKIYKDAIRDETRLYTAPADNPDYLGKFLFENGSVNRFEGGVLSVAEQAFLAVLIETYEEPPSI